MADASSGDVHISSSIGMPEPGAVEVHEALQQPTRNVSATFQITFFLANLVVWIAKFPVGQLLLATQIIIFDPGNKVADLALINGVGSAFALIANPIEGALSDRTTGRWGRRRPWLAIGAIVSALMLVVLALSPGIAWLLVGWTLYQIATNAVLAALVAVVPDQVPTQQRATVSASVGLSIPLGTVIGFIVVSQLFKGQIASAYFAIAGIMLVMIVIFALVLPDKGLPKGIMPEFHPLRFLASFWISPRRYPDFAWAWITRFLFILGTATGTNFFLYYLIDVVHYSRIFPHQTPGQGLTNFNIIYTAALVVSSLLGGYLSDKIQRRKIFEIFSAIFIAIGMLIIAFIPTWTAIVIGALIFGFGYGAFLAVDIAIITEVLPSSGNRGKDMGVINIANTLPQVVASVIFAFVVGSLHSYTALFVISGISGLLSGILIQQIRGVK